MTLRPTTGDEQAAALDVLIRTFLTDTPLTTELIDMLGTLQRGAGLRVATILIMLAGKAVPDHGDWRTLLNEHLAGTPTDA